MASLAGLALGLLGDGLLYQLTPEVGLFANASTSFKPNNGLDAAGKSFDPEEGIGYEVGIKSELFDDRLSTTLAAFHIEKENVLALDPSTDSSRAVGKARSQGVDLQVTGQVTDAVRVIDEKYFERSYSNYWVNPGEPRNFTVSLTLNL
ncbi:hypothetical protein BK662_00565 [Pseudomonas frederiksbergensis]|uniref:TonB-dependent receptor-like beta-barrel domain-containing protein n=1 Tax=Pseudomonas frederiksbergensis TaxID=104087 RepID=A0A423I2D8_9PSED|nr:hypothetical protein BK662_00565 [Pseudomonas frederiksbergensis]